MDSVKWIWNKLNTNPKLREQGFFNYKDVYNVYVMYVNIYRKDWEIKYYDMVELPTIVIKYAFDKGYIYAVDVKNLYAFNDSKMLTKKNQDLFYSREKLVYEHLKNRRFHLYGY